jgi:hypothetical protein
MNGTLIGGKYMDGSTDLKALRIALVVVGIIFIVGVYPLTIVWPAGWIWHAPDARIICR